MSKVEELCLDGFTATISPPNTSLRKKLKYFESPIVFDVHGEYNSEGAHPYYRLTFAPEPKILINQINYLVEYRLGLSDGKSWSGFFNGTTTAKKFNLDFAKIQGAMSIKLKFKKVVLTPFFYTVNADLKTYIERGPTVTLVGSDGSVSIPRRLIKMRSEALEAMFKHDSQEKRMGQIKMEEYDSKTLKAFKTFLMTGDIENGKDTALGLILLADKYDIQPMKTAAEDFVKENIKDMNEEEVLDILHKVSRRTLVDAMIYSWTN